MSKLQLFLQFEGHRRIELIQLDHDSLALELVNAAIRLGLANDSKDVCAFYGDDDCELKLDEPLSKQGVRDRHRVHVHRCRKIKVTLHFNEIVEHMEFPPSATIDRVKKKFVHAIQMKPVDASEHVLQLCGCSDRPEGDTQIGSLASHCSVCLDLVPIKRIEG